MILQFPTSFLLNDDNLGFRYCVYPSEASVTHKEHALCEFASTFSALIRAVPFAQMNSLPLVVSHITVTGSSFCM